MSIKYPEIVVSTQGVGATGLQMRVKSALKRGKVAPIDIETFSIQVAQFSDYNYIISCCATWVTLK